MSVAELKAVTDEFQKSWNDFKVENDKLIKEKSGLATEKVEKLSSQMDAIEAKFKKIELSNKTEEFKSQAERDEEKRKSAPETHYLTKGFEGMKDETKAKLIVGDSTNGGYLVRPEFSNEIIKKVTEMDPIRMYARVTQGSAGSLIYVKRNGLLTAYWVAEQGDVQKSNSTYGQGQMIAHAIAVDVPISVELLQDAFVNPETEIGLDAAEAFAYKEGYSFLLGNNVTEPEGILNNATVALVDNGSNGGSTIETETSDVFVADDIYNLMFELKTEYVKNAKFFGNRKTLKAIRKFKDDDHRYLLQTSQDKGITFELLGTPFVECPSMSSGVTTDAAQILMYGDMFRCYIIYDRIGMSVLRDPFTAKTQRMVEFQFEKRTGGKVKLAEAIKVLKVK